MIRPFIPLIALLCLTTVALAAPAPRQTRFNEFVTETARITGKPEKEVREQAIEVLRQSKKFTEADLARIGREKVDLGLGLQRKMTGVLRNRFSQLEHRLSRPVVPAIVEPAVAAFDALSVSRASQPVDAKLVEGVASSLKDFDSAMLKELDAANAGKNVFYSPFSLAQALAMTSTGAGGNTLSQMLGTMGLNGMNASEARSGWQGLLAELAKAEDGVTIANGNSIWAREGFQLKAEFKQANKEAFGAKVEELDFNRSDAVDVMNGWIAGVTNKKITQLLKGPIPGDVVSYLLNAVYFKGSWTTKFDAKNTKDQEFKLEDGSTTTVKMMNASGEFKYASEVPVWDGVGKGMQFLRLTYGKNERYAMDFVLPAEGMRMAEFVAKLDMAAIDKLAQRAEWANEGDIAIPKFKAEFEAELGETLQKLGMTDAFNSSTADFSNMANGRLYITKVKQKAVVEVTEEGAEAAAATSVEVGLESVRMPIRFVADRPFYFAIRDTQTGAVLFSGVMRNPNAK